MNQNQPFAYKNPVLPGFFPDPSAIRVGEDYYLVTSSFEYFPGVPIFRSKNLADWEQIGHVLTRKEQIDLSQRRSSMGIFASTLRYHEGLFYLVTTDVMGIGNFFVTASDPAGPWSDPIRLPYGGIDPSLMLDDDGRVFVTVQNGSGEESHIIQYEIDPRTGDALNEPRRIWDGDGGVWTEGPHLYKINGMYYILSACGGTGPDHRVIIGRSPDPYGPFEPCPYPILTHNRRPDDPLQCLGHADLFEDTNGNWWAVFLGTRPLPGGYSVLGRETFLAPVTWSVDGWPIIDNNEGTVRERMETDRLPDLASSSASVSEHGAAESEGQTFHPRWSFLRVYDEARYKPGPSADSFVLTGNNHSLEDDGPATFACVRQTDRHMRFSCAIHYEPTADGEEAGIAARLNHRAFLILSIKRIEQTRCIHLLMRNGEGVTQYVLPWEVQLAYLMIESDEAAYYCSYSSDGSSWRKVPVSAKAEWLSPEHNGGFTGVCIGMYASGNGYSQSNPAFFSNVQYADLNEGNRELSQK